MYQHYVVDIDPSFEPEDQPWVWLPIKDQEIPNCETVKHAVERGVKIQYVPEGVSGTYNKADPTSNMVLG